MLLVFSSVSIKAYWGGEERGDVLNDVSRPSVVPHHSCVHHSIDVPPLDECSVDMRTPSYAIYGQCNLCCIDAE